MTASPGLDGVLGVEHVETTADKVALGLLDEHARHCVIPGKHGDPADMTDELMSAVGRLMRRG